MHAFGKEVSTSFWCDVPSTNQPASLFCKLRKIEWIPEEHYRFATNHEESMLSDDTLSATDGAALRVGSSADGSASITVSTAISNSAGNGKPASSSFGELLACPAPEQGLVDNSYPNCSSNAVSSEVHCRELLLQKLLLIGITYRRIKAHFLKPVKAIAFNS